MCCICVVALVVTANAAGNGCYGYCFRGVGYIIVVIAGAGVRVVVGCRVMRIAIAGVVIVAVVFAHAVVDIDCNAVGIYAVRVCGACFVVVRVTCVIVGGCNYFYIVIALCWCCCCI